MYKVKGLAFLCVFLFCCSLNAERVISTVESSNTDSTCNKSCREFAKDAYGNMISQMVPSNYSQPQETYPGSNIYVCIPCECGDGVKSEFEECDAGEDNGKRLCSIACISLCGNGILDPEEDCDDGNKDNQDGCTNTCSKAHCGDGYIQNGVEPCDSGLFCSSVIKPANMPDFIFDNKKCSVDCNVIFESYCGDRVKNGKEVCDQEDFGNYQKPAKMPDLVYNNKTCSSNCDLIIHDTYCGDGIKNGAEKCDTNDFSGVEKPASLPDLIFNSKTCNSTCDDVVYVPYCGDGVKNGNELCEDNDFSGLVKPVVMPDVVFNSKTCDPVNCKPIYDSYCGDNVKNADEECDNTDFSGLVKPNSVPNEAFNLKKCSNDCKVNYAPFCGDGIRNGTDQCDGNNFSGLVKPAGMPDNIFNSKTCDLATCNLIYASYCGDGVVNVGEDCDDGNNSDSDNCSNSCKENDKCIYVAAWNNWSSDGHGELSLQTTRKRYEYIDSEKGIPGCFSAISSACTQIEKTSNTAIYGWCGGLAFTANGLGAFLGASYGPDFAAGPTTYYMDENCRWVESVPQGTKLCGFAGVSWSPISLILDESKLLEQNMSVVQFSLDPNNPSAYSLWKASEHAPLLVYDPEKTGNVTSVTQLFGNWTFGGKKSNVTDVSLTDTKKVPWDNGYEALASLDSNNNGKIDGDELKPLSLWFDKNRDAKVDEGELRSLDSEKITALFFGAKGITGSKDVKAEIGFERNVDGKVLKGSSVDWYAESFSSQKEASDALGAIINAPLLKETKDEVLDWKEKASEFTPHLVSDHRNDVSGFWSWKIEEKYGEEHPGMFAFEQKADGSIIGFSVVESQLVENKLGLRSGVKVIPLEGSVTKNKDGSKTFAFTVESKESGGKAINVVKISKDGKKLTGKTTQEFIGNEENPKSATVSYKWTAKKFANNKS